MGKRFVILNAPGFEQQLQLVEDRAQQPPTQSQRVEPLRIDVDIAHFTSDEKSAESMIGWYLYPDEFLDEVDSASVPSYLEGSAWTEYSLGTVPKSTLPPITTVGGRKCEIDISNRKTRHPQAKHRASWAYPMQVLQVPAVAIDIVTFPFQFWYLLGVLSDLR